MIHPLYKDISRQFRHRDSWTDECPLSFVEEGFDLFNLSFTSANTHFLLGHPSYYCEEHGVRFDGELNRHEPGDALIEQNIHFRYPLVREFAPAAKRPRRHHLLILLHGLNEHSFTKYIPWAYHIWKKTGRPVALFPLTFHINRVMPEWGRFQQGSFARRKALPGNENAHRFNAVISERLGAYPERFFWGAMQSYWDIVDLVRQIRRGEHPHIAEDARIDLLGYSAGGYVALALLLANEEGLFEESRGVLFATCAAMRDVNLSSHLIVDLEAEIGLMKLYVKYEDRLANDRLKHWLDWHPEGRWFNAFCGLMPNRTRLEARLKEIAPRILGIANSNDQVMPPGAMLNALQGIRRSTGVRIDELDLGIHENPFSSPDYNQRDRAVVLDFMDEERYGAAFGAFIEKVVGHIA